MTNRNAVLLLTIAFLVKCLLGAIIELNNDEVYYWTYAQKLQWNYFDHPPGIAILLRIFTGNLFFQGEFFLRLGSIVCAACSTWLIYLIGKRIKDAFTGFIAALLFTASPYCSIIAGLLVIPDAPQLVFWLWSVLLMLKIIEPSNRKYKLQRRLLLLGLAIGICILCKVHGVFLWVGFILYILSFHRKLLHSPFLFYSGFITVICISPIIFWNLSNDFISYRYHSSRVSFFGAVHIDGLLRELFGEVLYNNPIAFVLLIIALVAMIRKQRLVAKPAQQLLFFLSFPLIAVVLLMSLFKDTLPHWTGPAYTTLIPVTAAYLSNKQSAALNRVIPLSVKWALAFTMVLLIPAFVVIKWLPFNMGNKSWQQLGAGDPTLDMDGFKKFGVQFDSVYGRELNDGLVNKNAFLISDYWFPAAHLDYYAAQPIKMNFIAFGDLPAIHHYAWLDSIRPGLQQGDDAYFVSVSNYFNPPPAKLVQQFQQVSTPLTITQYRGGVAVRNFFIYRLRNFQIDNH